MVYQATTDFLHDGLAQLPFGVISIAQDKTIASCNQQAAILLNRPLDDIIGEDYSEVLGPVPSIDTYIKTKKFTVDSKKISLHGNQLVFSPLFIENTSGHAVGILLEDPQK